MHAASVLFIVAEEVGVRAGVIATFVPLFLQMLMSLTID